MRVSREKINKLAHAVADTLADMEKVDFVEDRNSIRLEVRRLLENLMAQEARIDAAARQKIESQRRTILEGSQEWDILYRKYYNEEVKKLGIWAISNQCSTSEICSHKFFEGCIRARLQPCRKASFPWALAPEQRVQGLATLLRPFGTTEVVP